MTTVVTSIRGAENVARSANIAPAKNTREKNVWTQAGELKNLSTLSNITEQKQIALYSKKETRKQLIGAIASFMTDLNNPKLDGKQQLEIKNRLAETEKMLKSLEAEIAQIEKEIRATEKNKKYFGDNLKVNEKAQALSLES